MTLTRSENTALARRNVQFVNGRAYLGRAKDGGIIFLEPNYMNSLRQYFSLYVLTDDLEHRMICTRASLETALRKFDELKA